MKEIGNAKNNYIIYNGRLDNGLPDRLHPKGEMIRRKLSAWKRTHFFCEDSDEEWKNWKACATTNWTLNGEFACRVLALEMAEQYDDIKAAPSYYESPGMWMEIPSVVVTQEQVMSGENITVKNLSDVAEDAYTDRSFMPSVDRMDSALKDKL